MTCVDTDFAVLVFLPFVGSCLFWMLEDGTDDFEDDYDDEE